MELFPEYLLCAAEAHEDCREDEGQADQNAPAPNEEDPAFFEQTLQVKVSSQQGVEQPGQQPD